MLESMLQAGWVRAVGRDDWELLYSPDRITLLDLFAQFAFSPRALPAAENENERVLRERLLRAYARAGHELGIPLSTLFQIG